MQRPAPAKESQVPTQEKPILKEEKKAPTQHHRFSPFMIAALLVAAVSIFVFIGMQRKYN